MILFFDSLGARITSVGKISFPHLFAHLFPETVNYLKIAFSQLFCLKISHKTRKRRTFVRRFPVLQRSAAGSGADGRIRIDHVHFPQRRQAAYVLTFRRFRGFPCPRLLPRKTRRKGKNKGEFSLPKPLTLCPIWARRSRFRMGKKSCTAGGLRYPGHIVKTFFTGGRRQ